MSRKNKFGSPYDPRYEGKQQRPQEKKEQEQHRLRGCGDPDCPMCNPETAGRGLGGGRRSGRMATMSGGPPPEFIRQAMMEMIQMEPSRMFRGDFAEESGPPRSYREARKAVEEYLSKAPDVAFDDIIGNDEALSLLRDAIEGPVKHKELYEAYGMRRPKGALLSGPPGCGKTMFAKAAASQMRQLYGAKEFEFISVSGSELQSPFVGETEGRIKAMFDFAREYLAYRGHPLLIFMDEAEVLLPDRTGRVRRVAPWEESQVATFLAEMDGMEECGAFLLLATNRPEVIDSAVLRDGRCDFKIVVQRPNRKALEVILEKNFKGVLLEDKTSVSDLVFAAVEGLYDPHKVILEAHMIGTNEQRTELKDLGGKAFCLEHIVSGAMAASIPERAKRRAFARDKKEGVARGVTASDVALAVNDVFEENRDLEHSFALEEFKAEFVEEFQTSAKRKMN